METPNGITRHPENDKMFAKKCSKCGKTMMGGFHEENGSGFENKWVFGCECGNNEVLDADGRQVED